MREALRRCITVAFAVILAASGSSCSSGGDDAPASGCTRAAVPSTGPGDPLNYFPSEVGWSWSYRIQSSGLLATMAVTGTQAAGTETASVFTSTSPGDPTPTVDLVVERPAGAYLLADPSQAPPFDQLYPSLIIPFPVAVTAPREQVRCTNLDVGDLDRDGRSDRADMDVSLQVFSITETAQVEAGSFTDLAHVQQVAHVTARSTSSGTVEVYAFQDDWFAQGAGRVVSRVTFSSGGLSDTDTLSLVSWTPPVAPAKPSGGEFLSPVAGERAPLLSEAALRLAGTALRAPR